MPPLGSIIEIDERTVLVLGQVLDVETDQPDVANALIHRVDDTVFVIDTGVTSVFRDAIRTAADAVGPWHKLVLLTTHGHPDHVGNNDVVTELADQRGATVEHYFPADDLAQMRNPQQYWNDGFHSLAGLAALPAAPALVAIKIATLFQPFHPFTRHSRTYEQLPLRSLQLGNTHMLGWSFAEGAVSVWRSQGHCAGHVLVYLRDNQLLHLGDEANGPCPVMPDADPVKMTATHHLVRALLGDDIVSTVTDGHTFTTATAENTLTRIEQLINQARALHQAAITAADASGIEAKTSAAEASTVEAADFIGPYTDAYRDLGVDGANPNPVFTGMMAARHLYSLGYRLDPIHSGHWRREPFASPDHHLETAAQAVTGALATVSWLAHGHQRSSRGPSQGS